MREKKIYKDILNTATVKDIRLLALPPAKIKYLYLDFYNSKNLLNVFLKIVQFLCKNR